MIEKLKEDEQNIIKKIQQTLPVDVVELARQFNVNAWATKLNGNASGQIIKNNNGDYEIYVSDTDIKKRQRFTVAHELAHFLLHKDQIGDGIVDNPLYRSTLSNKTEVEANKLAADILMPYNEINRFIDNKEVNTIDELADKFEVSTQAMKVRLGIPK